MDFCLVTKAHALEGYWNPNAFLPLSLFPRCSPGGEQFPVLLLQCNTVPIHSSKGNSQATMNRNL